MTCCGGASGLVEFERLLRFPENLVEQRVLPKPLGVIAAVISGMVKTVAFPFISALGVILFPLKACYELYHGRDAGKYWEATLISMAGVAASLMFLVFSAYHLPVLGASAIFLSCVTISIAVHVHKACKDPIPAGS